MMETQAQDQHKMNQGEFFIAFLNHLTVLRQEINILNQRLEHIGDRQMAIEDSVQSLEAKQAKLKQDVVNLKALFETFKQQLTDAQAALAEALKNGVTPEILARIQAVDDSMGQTDTDLDALAPDPATEAAKAKSSGQTWQKK